MSTTVDELVSRVFRTYLEPPDHQPVMALLGGTVDAVTPTITLAQYAIPEDEELMRVGILIEVDYELMRVTDYDFDTKEITVIRGAEDTTAAQHLNNAKVILSPSYPRQSVYEQVQSNILMLHDKLFTVRTDYVSTIRFGVAPLNDDLAVDVLEVWSSEAAEGNTHEARIIDYHPSVQGRAVETNCPGGSLWIKYRRRMGVADSASDLLEDLGMEEAWETIVMTGAAGDLMVGSDIAASHTDWISQTLEAETVRVGTRQNIGFGLKQYQTVLLKEAQREMEAEYRPRVRMRMVNTGLV